VIKATFSASLLQSSVSHDLSDIIIICRFVAELLHIFVEAVILLFSGFFDE